MSAQLEISGSPACAIPRCADPARRRRPFAPGDLSVMAGIVPVAVMARRSVLLTDVFAPFVLHVLRVPAGGAAMVLAARGAGF